MSLANFPSGLLGDMKTLTRLPDVPYGSGTSDAIGTGFPSPTQIDEPPTPEETDSGSVDDARTGRKRKRDAAPEEVVDGLIKARGLNSLMRAKLLAFAKMGELQRQLELYASLLILVKEEESRLPSAYVFPCYLTTSPETVAAWFESLEAAEKREVVVAGGNGAKECAKWFYEEMQAGNPLAFKELSREARKKFDTVCSDVFTLKKTAMKKPVVVCGSLTSPGIGEKLQVPDKDARPVLKALFTGEDPDDSVNYVAKRECLATLILWHGRVYEQMIAAGKKPPVCFWTYVAIRIRQFEQLRTLDQWQQEKFMKSRLFIAG
ncbi:hypothetical protein HK101_011436 [Irineochytrium annulatum]|nr:hypothetical protein HK101_011436 [Irineochytrium annulatum]